MNKVIIWNTKGEILKKFDDMDDATDYISDNDYEELDRTYKNGDTNIVVLDI